MNHFASRLRDWRANLDFPSYSYGFFSGFALGGMVCGVGENPLWVGGMGVFVAAACVAFSRPRPESL